MASTSARPTSWWTLAGTGPNDPLMAFYLDEVRPYLDAGRQSESALRSAARAAGLFADLAARAPAAVATVRRLEELCAARRQYDLQARIHGWLHNWLLIHLPLSVALSCLLAVHIVTALKYWYAHARPVPQPPAHRPVPGRPPLLPPADAGSGPGRCGWRSWPWSLTGGWAAFAAINRGHRQAVCTARRTGPGPRPRGPTSATPATPRTANRGRRGQRAVRDPRPLAVIPLRRLPRRPGPTTRRTTAPTTTGPPTRTCCPTPRPATVRAATTTTGARTSRSLTLPTATASAATAT